MGAQVEHRAQPVSGSLDRPRHPFLGLQRRGVASTRGVLARANETGLTALGNPTHSLTARIAAGVRR